MNVVLFLLGDSPAFEFYVPTFRNTLFHLRRSCSHDRWRWHIKLRRRSVTQKEECNIHNTTNSGIKNNIMKFVLV